MRALFLIAAYLASMMYAPSARAGVWAETARVCLAAGETAPPDFSRADCETLPIWEADPQGREIWLQAIVEVDDALADASPVAVFISAKAASEVFLNGRRLGANGRPAATKAAETPGRMDAVFFAPPGSLVAGPNEIAVRMSAHHGFLRFSYPVHYVGVGDYRDPTESLLGSFWPSLIPFGALIAGALYFAAGAFSGEGRVRMALLALVCFFAAGQLFVEVYRGLVAYDYPVHEWRMLAVVVLSVGFGLGLAALFVTTFVEKQRGLVMAGAAAAIVAPAALMAGYDAKAGGAVLAATAVSAAIAGLAARRGRNDALIYVAALAVFGATIIAFPNRFLDTIFFYELATLMLVLFVMQAREREQERLALAEERARARQLEAALERAHAGPRNSEIRISGAGAIDIVRSADIIYCKGAGDYVEIRVRDGRDILHSGSLAQLENDLPANFLRVHRSYIVNTEFVRTLNRDPSGVGTLTLECGAEVPVSRRIMPKVRSALG